MTRDGLIEVNETQQTAERISSREADSDFSQPDSAAAERVIEHLDAAHTRKANKKEVKKEQEATALRTSTSRLQFTEEERATPELETYIKKSEKAADRLDAAKAAIPKQKKLVKERTFDEAAGKAKTRLHFEEQEKPIPGGKAHSNPLSRPAQEAGIFVHNKIHSVEKDNSGAEGAHKSEELAERGARYGTRKFKQGYRSHKLKLPGSSKGRKGSVQGKCELPVSQSLAGKSSAYKQSLFPVYAETKNQTPVCKNCKERRCSHRQSNRRSVTDSSKESGCLCRATPGGRDNRYRRAASVHHGISRAFLLWGNVFRQHEQRVRDFLHVRGQRPCGNGTELCCNGKRTAK